MKRMLRWLVTTSLVLLVAAAAFVGYIYIASGRLMARTYRQHGILQRPLRCRAPGAPLRHAVLVSPAETLRSE